MERGVERGTQKGGGGLFFWWLLSSKRGSHFSSDSIHYTKKAQLLSVGLVRTEWFRFGGGRMKKDIFENGLWFVQ